MKRKPSKTKKVPASANGQAIIASLISRLSKEAKKQRRRSRAVIRTSARRRGRLGYRTTSG